MQRFCISCGNQLTDGQTNCNYCGTAQPTAPQTMNGQPMPGQMGAQVMQGQPMMNQQPMMGQPMMNQQNMMMNGQMPQQQMGNQMYQQPAQAQGEVSWGWVVLGFVIPIVGWILWGIWKNEKPATAKACGIAGCIGFVVNLFLLM